MKYTTSIVALAMALVARAAPIPQAATYESDNGRVDWISTDNLDRTINCACNPGFTCPTGIDLPAGQTVTTQFEEHFQGNCWATIVGEPNTGTGMLAELAFGAWQGLTYFDVSAIVVPSDTRNIYAMTPGTEQSPVSGCMNGQVGGVAPNIACADNLYVNPDDVQTKATQSNYIKVFVGPPTAATTTTAAAPVVTTTVAVSYKERSIEERSANYGREFIEGRSP